MSTTVEQAPKQDQSVLSYLFSLSPFESAHRLGSGRVPCARDSLLLGMGTAAAVGAVGTVAGRGVCSNSGNRNFWTHFACLQGFARALIGVWVPLFL